jgi:diadenosine tetraphosphate (Ap4A) HIT family hydrolase
MAAPTTPATSDCPFCRRLAALHELPPAELVCQLPDSVVFLGPWQYYHGYCVVVSRRHARELYDLAVEARRGYLDEMCLVARAIGECFRPHKLNYELLGNQVPHLHWHLFPRSSTDPEALQPVWLALARAEHDPEERRRLQTGPTEPLATAAVLRHKIQEIGTGTP